MKKSDLSLLFAVAIVAAILSLVLSNILFAPQADKQLTAQEIDPIESSFEQPDKRYFNDKSINPTQLIQIGNKNNSQPF